MDRRRKLLGLVDLDADHAIEIGALDSPLLTRPRAAVRYADRASTAELRSRYADEPRVQAERLVEVDYVCGHRSLSEAVGEEGRFGFAVASHVLHLVPDVIGFLDDLARVLRPGGLVCLALPDQRYTCDYFRRTTSLADLVDAHLRGLRRPSIAQVFDHFASHRALPTRSAWNGALHTEELRPTYSLAEALHMAGRAADEEILDCTCHAFTPASFCELLRGCGELDLLALEIAQLWPTAAGEHEFFVVLRCLDQGLGREARRRARVAAAPLASGYAAPPAAQAGPSDFLAASRTGGFDRRVYYVRAGRRYWVTSSDWATSAGFRWPEDIRWLADEEIAAYGLASGPPPVPGGS